MLAQAYRCDPHQSSLPNAWSSVVPRHLMQPAAASLTPPATGPVVDERDTATVTA